MFNYSDPIEDLELARQEALGSEDSHPLYEMQPLQTHSPLSKKSSYKAPAYSQTVAEAYGYKPSTTDLVMRHIANPLAISAPSALLGYAFGGKRGMRNAVRGTLPVQKNFMEQQAAQDEFNRNKFEGNPLNMESYTDALARMQQSDSQMPFQQAFSDSLQRNKLLDSLGKNAMGQATKMELEANPNLDLRTAMEQARIENAKNQQKNMALQFWMSEHPNATANDAQAFLNSQTFGQSEAQAAGRFPYQARIAEIQGQQQRATKAMPTAENAAGKMLPPGSIQTLTDMSFMPSLIGGLKKSIQENASVMGPITGRLRAINPWDKQAQNLQSQVNSARQLIGKAIEGGVLRKEDESKYEKILATLSDNPTTAIDKLNNMQKDIGLKYDTYLQGLGDAGYNISKFQRLNTPQTPNKTANLSSQEMDELAALKAQKAKREQMRMSNGL